MPNFFTPAQLHHALIVHDAGVVSSHLYATEAEARADLAAHVDDDWDQAMPSWEERSGDVGDDHARYCELTGHDLIHDVLEVRRSTLWRALVGHRLPGAAGSARRRAAKRLARYGR